MPRPTLEEISSGEHAHMRAELRRARYGYLLALHLLLRCAAGRTPSKVARVLFCSRSSGYRIVRAYRAETLRFDEATEHAPQPRRLRLLTPSLKRSVQALLKTTPRSFGWCRTRWSCAPLAIELQVRRGIEVSTETLRHWRHELGWEWKRAKGVAKDNDLERVGKLARIRVAFEQLHAGAACSLPTSWISICCPRSALTGYPKGTKSR